MGQEGGIVFQAGGGDYFYSYLELSKRIDVLILDGTYPFSAEEELDSFAIPDEKEELEENHRDGGSGSITSNVVEEQEDFHRQEQPEREQVALRGHKQPEAGQETVGGQEPAYGDSKPQEEEPTDGDGQLQEEEPTDGEGQLQEEEPAAKEEQDKGEPTGAELRYIQAVLRDRSRSMYLQKTIQEYFSNHQDKGERENFVKEAYFTGRRELEAEGVPVRAETRWDGMHIRAYDPTGTLEMHLSWEQVAAYIEPLIASGTYVNPGTPKLPDRQEIIDYFLAGSGSGYTGSKQHIYHAMTSILSVKDRVKALKNVYGTGGRRPL